MNLRIIKQSRAKLLTIFSKGLQSVNGQHSVFEYLRHNSLPTGQIWVVAVGKAACSMMRGLTEFLESVQQQTSLASALVITKQGYAELFEQECIDVIESDHPIPSERSLEAGQRLVDFVQRVPEQDTLLFLISGGTSALVEVLAENVSIEQLVRLNCWLLSNPWSIDQINQVRQTVSRIKGGKLLDIIRTAHCIQLTISDVASNDLSVIGSGLLVKPESKGTFQEINVPDWVKEMQPFQQAPTTQLQPVPVEHHIVADNAQAREAITDYAESIGLQVISNQTISGDIETASEVIARTLIEGPDGLYLWGGETVVDLPKESGQGGRCQSLALLIAEKITGYNDIVVLAAGTDGTDGPGDVAGAMIDGMTIVRGMELGLDSRKELLKANAGYYLEETSDLVDTGPTGTNVMDLIIAIKLQ